MASKQKSAMNMVFISTFLEATTKVITSMAQIDVRPQAPMIKKDSNPLGDIACVMPMTTPSVKGQLVLSFTELSLLGVTSKVLGEVFSVINDEVKDMLGEITNIATGGAKALLDLKGYDFDMARPYVITKSDFGQLDLPSKTQIVIPYQTDCGPIYIEIGFEHIGLV